MRDTTRIPPSVPCPSEEARPYVRFLRVHPEQVYRLAIASTHLWACLTHWYEGRTRWCPADLGECPYCQANLPQRWTGFLVVYQRQTTAPALFDFYGPAFRHCPPLAKYDGQLQRAVVEVRRLGPDIRSPLAITWTGQRQDGPLTPVEPPALYLARLWNVDLTAGEVGRG